MDDLNKKNKKKKSTHEIMESEELNNQLFAELTEFIMGVPKDRGSESIIDIKKWNEDRMQYINSNPDILHEELEFIEGHKRFIDFVKFNFKGKDLTLSSLLSDEITSIILEFEKPSEKISVIEELIDCIEREIDKRSSGLKVEEFHWRQLLNIIEIKDHKLRMNEFVKFLDQEKGKKENLIFFSENEKVNRILNNAVVEFCIYETQKIIQGLFFTRNLFYFNKTEEYLSSEWLSQNKLNSLNLFFNNMGRDDIIFYKTEKDLIELFSKLVNKKYLSPYVVGRDKKGKHGFTKIRWGHFKEHFRKLIYTEKSKEEKIMDFNENELETEFNKNFYKEKDDTLIEMEKELENTCFIWEGAELHWVHLLTELTERKIIKGKESKKDKSNENKPINNNGAIAPKSKSLLTNRSKSQDTTSSNNKPPDFYEITEIRVLWKCHSSHFMFVKNGALEIIDHNEMNSQKNNLKGIVKRDEANKNENQTKNINYIKKKQNDKNIAQEEEDENEYEEINQILHEIFGPRPSLIKLI